MRTTKLLVTLAGQTTVATTEHRPHQRVGPQRKARDRMGAFLITSVLSAGVVSADPVSPTDRLCEGALPPSGSVNASFVPAEELTTFIDFFQYLDGHVDFVTTSEAGCYTVVYTLPDLSAQEVERRWELFVKERDTPAVEGTPPR